MPLEAGEMGARPLGLAVGRVDVGHARRIAAAPGAIIARISPKLPGLGASTSRIEHRRRRLVGEQLGRALERHEQAFVARPQHEGGAADPVSQGRAIERNALPRVDLSLAVQRKMIGVFGYEDLRHGRLGR